MSNFTVLGAGISGISAGYHAKKYGYSCRIFEGQASYGGLCDNFTIDGFRFDNAVHLSFTNDIYVKELFAQVTFFAHKPEAYNFAFGHWLKHPVQNNLYPLSADEKIAAIKGFIERPSNDEGIENYKEWLEAQYGRYIAKKYPIPYTEKYWTVNAEELGLEWIGNRMYRPSIDEVLFGAMSAETPNTYYAKEMRYPQHGGYKSFLQGMAQECTIKLNKQVVHINLKNKCLEFADGSKEYYENLINTLPLPTLISMIDNVPEKVMLASQNLLATSVALVSVGFNSPDIAKYLWFYIYDDDIKAARVYSPSLKSGDNVPKGCSSLQFEIYYSKYKPLIMDKDNLKEHVVASLKKMNIAYENDICVMDCKLVPFANVVFAHDTMKNREIVKRYLIENGVRCAGRFGEWDYFWSDQSLLSGRNIVENL